MSTHFLSPTLSDIASSLRKVKWQGEDKFSACCPAHDDHNPSFNAKAVHGKILVKCFAGCTQDEVINALKDRRAWPCYPSHKASTERGKSNDHVIWKHQMLLATELARASQGYSHTEDELRKIQSSAQFLEDNGYGHE